MHSVTHAAFTPQTTSLSDTVDDALSPCITLSVTASGGSKSSTGHASLPPSVSSTLPYSTLLPMSRRSSRIPAQPQSLGDEQATYHYHAQEMLDLRRAMVQSLQPEVES